MINNSYSFKLIFKIINKIWASFLRVGVLPHMLPQVQFIDALHQN